MPPLRRDTHHDILLKMFDAGVRCVQAENCLPSHLPPLTRTGRTLVLGAGKASAAMAAVVASKYGRDISGLVVTRYGHGLETKTPGIEVIEAAHPVPDARSQAAANRMLELAGALTAADRLIFLASGGGSSVLSLPAPGFRFEQKQALIKHLLRSGASISEINCVRKHVSAIKGGRLAEAAGEAEIHTFVISDVPSDNPSDVASGPTIPDQSTLAGALDVIRRYGAPELDAIHGVLNDANNETGKISRPNWHTHIVGTATECLRGSEKVARGFGYPVINLGANLEGLSSDLGREHASLAKKMFARGQPVIIISGGETTVKVNNLQGCGGRNMEYALALAIELDGHRGISALASDTDGIDGSEDAAGALINNSSIARAHALGLDPHQHLANNRSYAFFRALGDLVETGPTRTNVNDFRAILVDPRDGPPTM